jgi:hypothetical protein
MTLYNFTFSFIGRTRGAIGITYKMKATVQAEQEADAILRLYDDYESITNRVVVKKTKVTK